MNTGLKLKRYKCREKLVRGVFFTRVKRLNKIIKLPSMTYKSKCYTWICLMLGFCNICGYVFISKNSLRRYDIFTNIKIGEPITTDSKFPSYVETSNQNKTSNIVNHSVKLNLTRNNTKHCFHLSFGFTTLKELGKTNVIGSNTFRNASKGTGYVGDRKTGALHHNGDSLLCNRFVTILFKRGRTGNQMFEIASLIGTAYQYDVIPVIPKLCPLQTYFNLPNIIDTNLNINKIIHVENCNVKNFAAFYNCSKEFNHLTNISMNGYLQSWKYFENANDMIRETLKLKSKHLINAKRFLSNVSIAGYQRVCIHVRRGDVIGLWLRNVAGLDYIERAKNLFTIEHKQVQFIVVSDDKTWCRKHLKDVIISPFNNPGDDMALMKLSDHVIVTVGTFGWWGAWLSGGKTVYYKKPFRFKFNLNNYFPKSWIGIL